MTMPGETIEPTTSPGLLYSSSPNYGLPGDHHVHSEWSDGIGTLWGIVKNALNLSYDYIVFSDHLNVDPDKNGYYGSGRNTPGGSKRFLDEYAARAERIEELKRDLNSDPEPGEVSSIAIGNGVEVDYDSEQEELIEDFLETAGFDVVLASVHHDSRGYNYGQLADFQYMSKQQLVEKKDEYFQYHVDLIESPLAKRVDVVAHPDRIETNPVFREIVSREDYRPFIDALEKYGYPLFPELNGKILERTEEPTEWQKLLREEEMPYVVGGDVHREGVKEGKDYHPCGELGSRHDDLYNEVRKIGRQPESLEHLIEPITVNPSYIPDSNLVPLRT